MDYGVEVPSYRRIDNEKKIKKINFENGLLGLLIVLFSGVMISRVGFIFSSFWGKLFFSYGKEK